MNQLPFGLGRRSTRGHVRRTKRNTLPWWLVLVIGGLGLFAILVLLGVIFPDGEDEEVVVYHNRTWLSDNWTTFEISEEQIAALAERLNEHKINMIYVVTGNWRVDLNYREYAYAQRFRELMTETAPQIKVLNWIWIDRELYNEIDTHDALASYVTKTMDDWGYDGVHIQGFEVFDGSTNYIQLLRTLDETVESRDGTLSISVPPDRRPADSDVPVAEGNPAYSWSPRYKQQVALIVDEMVIMAHAAGFTATNDYEEWVAYQVDTYANDVRRVNDEVDIIVALPTYPTATLHDPFVENVETALTGLKQGIDDAGNARSMVRGVGVYFYDDATSQDWALFKEHWVE